MRRGMLTKLACATVLGSAMVFHSLSANGEPPPPSPTVYNPYPPGILPSNLSSEIARVLREVDVIEGRAIARWHALKPPILTGQPGASVVGHCGGDFWKHSRMVSPGLTATATLLRALA
jgi:hypothetical protein